MCRISKRKCSGLVCSSFLQFLQVFAHAALFLQYSQVCPVEHSKQNRPIKTVKRYSLTLKWIRKQNEAKSRSVRQWLCVCLLFWTEAKEEDADKWRKEVWGRQVGQCWSGSESRQWKDKKESKFQHKDAEREEECGGGRKSNTKIGHECVCVCKTAVKGEKEQDRAHVRGDGQLGWFAINETKNVWRNAFKAWPLCFDWSHNKQKIKKRDN